MYEDRFWCPSCKLVFSTVDKKGIAQCPNCGFKRTDGFNQLEDGRLQCVICKLSFPEMSKDDSPICPNGCEYQGGEKP